MEANKEYYVWNNGSKQFDLFVGDETSPDWERAREKCSLVENGKIAEEYYGFYQRYY